MAKKILLADDEVNIVRIAQMTLRRNGYEVIAAADGKEALEKVRSERPDVIVLDVMMPHLDGFEFLRIIKADPETRDIPVIMLTAQAKNTDILHGMEAGAAFYLTKPFNPVELSTFVSRALAGERDES